MPASSIFLTVSVIILILSVIFIGHHPNSELIGDFAKLDKGGHAFVNLWMETEQPGLYVAGDVRVDSARQLASAVGDGVTAAIRSEHYLQDNFDNED